MNKPRFCSRKEGATSDNCAACSAIEMYQENLSTTVQSELIKAGYINQNEIKNGQYNGYYMKQKNQIVDKMSKNSKIIQAYDNYRKQLETFCCGEFALEESKIYRYDTIEIVIDAVLDCPAKELKTFTVAEIWRVLF